MRQVKEATIEKHGVLHLTADITCTSCVHFADVRIRGQIRGGGGLH